MAPFFYGVCFFINKKSHGLLEKTDSYVMFFCELLYALSIV